MQKTLIFFLLMVTMLFTYCKKDNGSNSNDNQNPAGTGKFSIAGKNYIGQCVATPAAGIGNNGVDVGIVTTNADAFAIGNLSAASSGSSAFSDGWTQPSGTTFGVVNVANSTVFMGTRAGGTVTKTGAKTFTFSCTVYDLTDGSEYTVTGSGNYE